MIEIILEDLVGGTDVPGVEVLLEEIIIEIVEVSSGRTKYKAVASTVRNAVLQSSARRDSSVLTSSTSPVNRAASGLQVLQVLQGGVGSASLRSDSVASRHLVSSGGRSQFETGTLRS